MLTSNCGMSNNASGYTRSRTKGSWKNTPGRSVSGQQLHPLWESDPQGSE